MTAIVDYDDTTDDGTAWPWYWECNWCGEASAVFDTEDEAGRDAEYHDTEVCSAG